MATETSMSSNRQYEYFDTTAFEAPSYSETADSRNATSCPLSGSIGSSITSSPDLSVVRSWESERSPQSDLANAQIVQLNMKGSDHEALTRNVAAIAHDVLSLGAASEQQPIINFWQNQDVRPVTK
jgi:hypothetical protein